MDLENTIRQDIQTDTHKNICLILYVAQACREEFPVLFPQPQRPLAHAWGGRSWFASLQDAAQC